MVMESLSTIAQAKGLMPRRELMWINVNDGSVTARRLSTLDGAHPTNAKEIATASSIKDSR